MREILILYKIIFLHYFLRNINKMYFKYQYHTTHHIQPHNGL